MPSRLLIGASGWLLGAVTATAGSLYAVDQLGQGLIAQHSKRVSVAMVNRELAQENRERPAAGSTPSAHSSPSASASASSRPVRKAGQAPGTRSHRLRTPSTTRVLNSAGGQVEAACKQGDAYLVYEIPGQGFDIHDLRPGPAAGASVAFTSSTGGVQLKVTCSSTGIPVEHVSSLSWGGGSNHDE